MKRSVRKSSYSEGHIPKLYAVFFSINAHMYFSRRRIPSFQYVFRGNYTPNRVKDHHHSEKRLKPEALTFKGGRE